MGNGILMPKSLDLFVRAICADYPRRKEVIVEHSASRRVESEMKYYNYKLFDAASEIVGERMAEDFIREIGERVGYTNSSVLYMSETTYKTRKQETVLNIAKRLYLLDV